MYKTFKYFLLFIVGIVIAIAVTGMYKFNIVQDDVYVETPSGDVLPVDEYPNESAVIEPVPPSAEEPVLPNELVELTDNDLVGTWMWTATTTNADPEEATATQPQSDAFTITFAEDGSVKGTTDCNNFSGSYGFDSEDGFIFGPMMGTLMYCEESQEGQFHNMLKYVTSYFINDDGELVMEMWADGGALIFKN